MKLLLVEDDRLLSGALCAGLKKLGYAVDRAFDGADALEQYSLNEYDLLILDLNLPVLDGFSLLSAIRSRNALVKILVLSAKNEIESKLQCFELGANDYLTKPFDMMELYARIQALLRRNFQTAPSRLQVGTITLNTATKKAFVQEKPLELTRKELGILEYLMSHPGEVISAETLVEHIWESDVDLFSNSLKFHMSSLRKKIRSCNGGENPIFTLRGQGYGIGGDGGGE